MSDKQPELTNTTTETSDVDASKPAPTSIPAAASSSPTGSTFRPPPLSSPGRPRGISVPPPAGSRPGASLPKPTEEDIFSVFNTKLNQSAPPPPVVENTPLPTPSKPPSQLGTMSEEREVTRSRQIPIDQDLFHLSASLFSSSEQGPLVSADVSALSSRGLSDKGASHDAAKPHADDNLFSVPPTASLDSLDALAPKAVPAKSEEKHGPPRSNRSGLIVGIFVGAAIAGGAFFFMQRPPATDTKSPTGPQATTTEAPLDTRPGQTAPTTEATARPAATEKAPDQPAEAANAAATTTAAGAPKEHTDKPGSTDSPDKQAAQDKPAGAEASAKAEEPPAPTAAPEPPKPVSLAEAMAQAAGPGGPKTAEPPPAATPPPPPPPPPPPSGPEFDKAAASAALNGAAGAASGCKAAGDPTGTAKVSVTFAPSGKATRAIVNGPPFAGTPTGSCVAAAFRTISIPPFSGDPVTVGKSVTFR